MRYELKYNASFTCTAEIICVADTAYVSFMDYDIIYNATQDSFIMRGIPYNKKLYSDLKEFLMSSITDALQRTSRATRSIDTLLGVKPCALSIANAKRGKRANVEKRNLFEFYNKIEGSKSNG